MAAISKYRSMCFLSKQKSAGNNWFTSVNHAKKFFPLSALPQEMKMPTFNSKIFKVPTIQMNIRQ